MLQKIDGWTARNSNLVVALMVMIGISSIMMSMFTRQGDTIGTGLSLVGFALLARLTMRRYMRGWPIIAFIAMAMIERDNLQNLEVLSIVGVLICALAVVLVLAPRRPQPAA